MPQSQTISLHLSSFPSSPCCLSDDSGLMTLPHHRPGTALHWHDAPLLSHFISVREGRSLSVCSQPWAVSWKSSFRFKSILANSRGFSASCNLAAQLASKALSAGIVFDPLLSFPVTGLPQCAVIRCPLHFHCFIHNITATPYISIQTINSLIKALVISHLCLELPPP